MGMTPKAESEFSIPDLYLAAYLIAAGAPLVRCDRQGSRCYFVFVRTDNVEELKQLWFANRAPLKDAQHFTNVIKSLKSLVHMS